MMKNAFLRNPLELGKYIRKMAAENKMNYVILGNLDFETKRSEPITGIDGIDTNKEITIINEKISDFYFLFNSL